MADEQSVAPDSTAVRVALWRAMHVQVDPPPHVLEDEIGLRLVAPDESWRRRPDMDPQATRGRGGCRSSSRAPKWYASWRRCAARCGSWPPSCTDRGCA